MVVAGASDGHYFYARHLTEEFVVDRMLAPSSTGKGDHVAASEAHCAATPITARAGRRVDVACSAPDVDTTEGETTAATRIAHERGWGPLLVVAYGGHVSRVRLYLEQRFAGNISLTGTPRPFPRHARTHFCT